MLFCASSCGRRLRVSISEHARAHALNQSAKGLRPRRLVGRDSELRDVSESITSAPRLIDAGNVVVMQGHYVGKGKATGKSVRAAAAHILEISDGKIVRFDQYVDSATINPIIGA